MKAPTIAVIDYGMGNLRSVAKALELAGASVRVTDKPSVIASAHAAVFPGVGAFGPAIEYLSRNGIDEAIAGVIGNGKAFLGLCLGFQLLFDYSAEGGTYKGLGVIPGKVVRFAFAKKSAGRKLTVPHMGWNRVNAGNSPSVPRLFKGIPNHSFFYFVHSYYGMPKDKKAVAGSTAYGNTFCSAIAQGRTWACQFHPEKSGAMGIQLLKNFVQEAKK